MLCSLALSLLTVAPGLSVQEAGPSPFDPELERARLRAHYERVERELLAAQPALDIRTMAARERTIDGLRAYRLAGDFGRSVEAGERRVFLFVDDDGRRCAVAQLLHLWGEDELVADVAASNNEAVVEELCTEPRLLAWLDRVGLSVEEAIRIQGPSFPVVSEPITLPDLSGFRGPGGGLAGNREGLAREAAPTTGPVRLSPAAGTAATRAMSPAAAGASGASSSGARLPEGIDLRTHWWAWWEYNKLGWLVPERSLFEGMERDAEHTRAVTTGERLRQRALPLLRAGTTDESAEVREAAQVAYGRVAGEAAVEAAIAGLGDPQARVRVASILALGATGSSRAAYELVKIVYADGLPASDPEPDSAIVQDAAFHARLALGLAAQQGGIGAADIPLPRDASDEPAYESLAFLQSLVASPRYMETLRDASGLFDEQGRIRKDPRDAFPRGVEALGCDPSEAVLPALVHALGARDLEVRRSAAMALCERDSERVLPALMTAYEMERESLTRGLFLIAIGQREGVKARSFLLQALKRGHKNVRPWGALALGILAGREDDSQARAGLRTAYAKERNRDAAAAYLLAFGVGRDVQAAEILEYELRTSGTALTRANAALGLALTGAPQAASILRTALETEASPLTRSTIAQALGVVGDPEDAWTLVSYLEEVSDPILVVQHAAAVAFHGDGNSAESLIDLLEREGTNASTRAGAMRALGMMLDEERPFRLATLSRNANFSNFPVSLDPALQSTL